MLAWTGAEIATKFRSYSKAVAVLGLMVLFGGLLLMTSFQLRSWRDSETLFRHAIAVTKSNYFAHNMLGRVLADQGRFDEAEAHFEEVLRIFPNQPEAHFSLGVISARKAKFDEALAHYTQAVEIPPDAATHYNLGNLLMKVDRANEAIAHFAEAVRLDPQMAEAQNNWAYALTTQGRLREAADHFAAALRIKPDLLATWPVYTNNSVRHSKTVQNPARLDQRVHGFGASLTEQECRFADASGSRFRSALSSTT